MVRRKLGRFPSFFRSIFFVVIQTAIFLTLTESLSSPLAPESRSPKDVSADIVRKLRSSSSTTSKLLDLETDFYDAVTGLHSEGVWHNALVGIALLESSSSNNNREDFDHADRIASALFRYSWDGNTSFCRRSWSGRWDHSSLDSDTNPPEQANYYRESSEHRCVQHGMALAFWSKLVLLSESGDENDLSTVRTEEQRLIAGCFAREFWDPSVRKWTTISQSQGGGDVSRPSASADKRTLGLSDEEKTTPYYRAVDQAVAVLAALEHLRVLNRGNNDDDAKGGHEEEQNVWIDLVRTTCSQLLAPVEDGGFGYGNVGQAKSYLGLDRNRNFWHDGWTFLALLKAREHISWPSSSADSNGNINHGESELVTMWHDLLEIYECKSSTASSGVVWHWPQELKDENSNVRYCGDNVLAHAIRRNLHPNDAGKEKQEEGFWNFVASIGEGNDGGLASVADVYPQVRLHPNTELSALLVWP